MRPGIRFIRWLTGFILLAALGLGSLGGAGLSARAAPVPQAATNIVVSEFRTRGPNGGNDEFVELYNPTSASIDISGWEIWGSNSSGSTSLRATIPSIPALQPGQHYLLANTSSGGYSGPYDLSYSVGITDDGGIALIDSGIDIDKIGMSSGSAYYEGVPLAPLSVNSDQSYERKNGGAFGNCIDGDDNSKDFIYNDGSGSTPNPQTSSDPVVLCNNVPFISEVAWAGTQASGFDEWIELHNPGSNLVNLSGWKIEAADGDPSIPLTGTIAAGGYYLLERSDSFVTNVAEDQVYMGGLLTDAGETLYLLDTTRNIIDTANAAGGVWPAGGGANFSSMERVMTPGGVAPDGPFAWITNDGTLRNGQDAAGNDIYGTPGQANWAFSVTPTFTPTITPSPTPTFTPTPTSPLTVVINEVAWMGTQAYSDDEWLELYNPGAVDINLAGWVLKSDDGSPDITLSGTIQAGDYFLLERTDDNTVLDVTADLIYSGSLSNSGEILRLYDPGNQLVDTANINGSAWPAGTTSNYASMQRSVISADSDFVWVTYDVSKDNPSNFAHDADGNEIKGTPGRGNLPINVTPTPTVTLTPYRYRSPTPRPGTPVPILGISEFLPRPGHDWNNDGQVDVGDEFIEVINAGSTTQDLKGWKLDDEENLGSSPYTLPSITLDPGERAVFYASETGILLGDGGDTVRLLKSNGVVADAYTYDVVRYPDQSICRIPDRMGYWNEPCFPTPGNPNALTGIFPVPSRPPAGPSEPVCLLPDTTPDVFVYAECTASGGGIWNRQYWDGTGFFEWLVFDETQKWEAVFE